MGQKVNPIGFRIGINKTWQSRWYAEKNYADFLHEDLKIKKFIKNAFYHAGISRVEIERAAEKTTVNIYTARPGILIGRRGTEVDQLKKKLQQITNRDVHVNICEVRKAELDAQLVAENVALQLERRVAFRRAMKRSVTTACAPVATLNGVEGDTTRKTGLFAVSDEIVSVLAPTLLTVRARSPA